MIFVHPNNQDFKCKCIRIYKLERILMLEGHLKSASNFKDFFYKILYLKAEIQFKLINFDICDWWIENYLRSDWRSLSVGHH